ncbi:MAG: benzoyl-CoA reductase subunit A [Deltaproteobacteria bacterium]|nr:benzoyl-CoA reductase subunit A [Deltaproteobacteria bacterium]
MRCVVGIDLGSTTTKAVLLDEAGRPLSRGITNSRSNYGVASAAALAEARTAARFSFLERAVETATGVDSNATRDALPQLFEAFRLELHLDELKALREAMHLELDRNLVRRVQKSSLGPAADAVLDDAATEAPKLFAPGAERRSEFFRDLAQAAFIAGAEKLARRDGIPFEPLVGLFDRAILEVETRLRPRSEASLLRRGLARVQTSSPAVRALLEVAIQHAVNEPLDEVAFTGTGYGRQTLPFPKAAVRSEILCHGRGAHRRFPGTRTVLDVGGQDTKGIQVDEHGVVTSFQMNDRCAAGCGRYLGYIADELGLGLHELGPLALQAKRVVNVNSTCTVFAGAELRERLSLGQKREDILAGLHRGIMLRAMSILARSGGVFNEFTFTGGVCRNPMAVKILRGLVADSYGSDIVVNIDPDSIFMGALGAALYALDDLHAGNPQLLPSFEPTGTMPPHDMRGEAMAAASCATCEAH